MIKLILLIPLTSKVELDEVSRMGSGERVSKSSSRFVSRQFPSFKEGSRKKFNADTISSIPYLKQTLDRVSFRREGNNIDYSSRQRLAEQDGSFMKVRNVPLRRRAME